MLLLVAHRSASIMVLILFSFLNFLLHLFSGAVRFLPDSGSRDPETAYMTCVRLKVCSFERDKLASPLSLIHQPRYPAAAKGSS